VHTFNLGTRTTTSVTDIADAVAAGMGLDPEYAFTGGERGWTGDVPRMRLSVDRLADLGFDPEMDSDEAVERAVRELIPRHAPAYADAV
jgi:UDP-glucose 4-epimerase